MIARGSPSFSGKQKQDFFLFLVFKLPCAFLVCPMYMTFSRADPEINPQGREAAALIGSGCVKSVLERK